MCLYITLKSLQLYVFSDSLLTVNLVPVVITFQVCKRATVFGPHVGLCKPAKVHESLGYGP